MPRTGSDEEAALISAEQEAKGGRAYINGACLYAPWAVRAHTHTHTHTRQALAYVVARADIHAHTRAATGFPFPLAPFGARRTVRREVVRGKVRMCVRVRLCVHARRRVCVPQRVC